VSENSKKVSITIQTYSLVRKGITPPTKGLTLTLTADTVEEVHAKIEKLYAAAGTNTKENKNVQEESV
jgi:hypothetical protein